MSSHRLKSILIQRKEIGKQRKNMDQNWYEELYGQLVPESEYRRQYALLVQKYPKWKSQLYEENPVQPGYFYFKNTKKKNFFETFVTKYDLSVSLKSITTGESDPKTFDAKCPTQM